MRATDTLIPETAPEAIRSTPLTPPALRGATERALAAVFDDPQRAEGVGRAIAQRFGLRAEVQRPRAGRLLASPWRAAWSAAVALRGLWTAGTGRWPLRHLVARRRAEGKAVLVLRGLDPDQQAQLMPVLALSARSWALIG